MTNHNTQSRIQILNWPISSLHHSNPLHKDPIIPKNKPKKVNSQQSKSKSKSKSTPPGGEHFGPPQAALASHPPLLQTVPNQKLDLTTRQQHPPTNTELVLRPAQPSPTAALHCFHPQVSKPRGWTAVAPTTLPIGSKSKIKNPSSHVSHM